MSNDFDRQALISIFVAEATDGMTSLRQVLNPVDGALPSAEVLQCQYIVGHKIRGAAALYGFTALAELAELLETMLEQAHTIPSSDWPRAVETIGELVAHFQSQVDSIGKGGGEDQQAAEQWKTRCAPFLSEQTPSDATFSPQDSSAEDYLVPNIDAEVLSYFGPEVQEYLDSMGELLRRVQADPQDRDSIHQLFRTAHTLKGSAQTVGFRVIGDIAHPLEDCYVAVKEGRLPMSQELTALTRRAIEIVRVLMRRDPANLGHLRQEVPALQQVLRQLEQGQPVAPSPALTAGTVGMSAQDSAPSAAEAQRAPDRVGLAVIDENTLSDTYLIPNLDPEVLSYFAPEAHEYLETLEALLLRLEREPDNSELIHQLFRTAHTLKGSAHTVGFQAIGDLLHDVEDYMGAVREGKMAVVSGHADLLLRAVDVVRTLMRRDPGQVRETRQRFASVMRDLRRLSDGVPSEAVSAICSPVQTAQPAAAAQASGQQEQETQKGQESRTGDDRAVIRVSSERLERLLNLVGELVIGRGRLEQRLRVLEQLSLQVMSCKNRLVDAVQTFQEKHMFTLPTQSPGSAEAGGQAFSGTEDFGALEFDKYDDFNILARRISEVTADISESMSQLNSSIRRSHEDMSQLQQLTLGMRDEIARARMVPIGTPFTRFRRAVRETSRSTAKEVTLVTSGEHTEVDTNVVERLVDPLIHLVRNAVYHGIEPTAVRLAMGKPRAGTVYLHAAHRGNEVVIEVEDDGAGLDIEKIRKKAVDRGVVRAEVAKSLTESEVIKFIFLPGFSTADKVGEQAGRGVGLDVVKRVIESMNGYLEVESVVGVGTKFILHLPLTLLISTALLVRVGTHRYAIPLQSVREVTMPSPGSVQQVADRTLLQVGDEAVEVHSLHAVLGQEAFPAGGPTPIVLVRTMAGVRGLAVDELLGRQEIVIKRLGTLKALERSYFGGATIDPEGRVVLVLDVGRLGGNDQGGEGPTLDSPEGQFSEPDVPALPTPPEDRPSGELPLLLIDDSLSVRKFVSRMLESAGYEVETAVDGEEGLRMANERTYQLIITDLEMPKMNGYEVIQALRSRPQTQRVPIMVMTTRAGDKHRQMAMNIGANAYIAKPVEERALIREVQRWIGREAGVKS